ATPEGTPTPFVCPECGGLLRELQNGNLLRFKCHVGHAFTAESLVDQHNGSLEYALWSALRALEEAASLRQRMARHARKRRMAAIAEDYERQREDLEERAAVIRKVLVIDGHTGSQQESAAGVGERARRASPGNIRG